MDRLPSSIMLDIFSRVPDECLARSRCVSKVWCEYINDPYLTILRDGRVKEEPTPILYHSTLGRSTHGLCFHVLETKQTRTADEDYVLERKEGPFLEYVRKKRFSKSSIVGIEFRGSCNGLTCLSQDEDDIVTSLVVVHPLKKQCYELPPLPMRFDSEMFRESCGLGFDASTNTLKMVCVNENLCTMVHVFGTNSWLEIPQVPSYGITGKAVFANGCLHWLVSYDLKTNSGGRLVIWFDVEKEEFGLIDPHKQYDFWRKYSCYYDHLVDLNGKVGYVRSRAMVVWVLNKQKEWVPYCWLEKTIVPDGDIEVFGCWNLEGDLLIRNLDNLGSRWYKFCIYNLKSGVLHKTSIVGPDSECDLNIFMHPNKLFSIHGIGTNSSPLRKTNLKKSFRRLLSCIRY